MYLDVLGTRTFFATGGQPFNRERPTVLFVHGSGLDHRSWALQTRWFAFHGYSVLAPDLPGHGLSQGVALTDIETMGRWLAQGLAAAGIDAAHVVGHSQGFLCALELARHAPERVKSLTGIGTAARIPVNPDLIKAAESDAAQAADMMLRWGFGNAAQLGVSAVPGMQPIAIGRAIMSRNPLAADLKACAAYTAGGEAAQALRLPARLILAGRDRMTPLQAGVALAALLDAPYTVLDGYGHMLPIEAPKPCLACLRDQLSELNSPRPPGAGSGEPFAA